MRFKQYITELAMKRKTDIKYEGSRGSKFTANITLEDGTKFLFTALENSNIHTATTSDWIVQFEGSAGFGKPIGAGVETTTAIQLFAALGVVFKEFVKREKPSKITFIALTKSRIKLYDTASKRIAKQLKYKVTRKTHEYKDTTGVAWEFTK